MNQKPSKPIKILLVDDRPNNLRVLSNILIEQGYQVQRAISGQLALNAAFASPPDLILLDIMMPEMDGYEVCQRLKENEITKQIPVIFLSVLDDVQDKIKAFKVGGSDYINKPFQLEEVVARINSHIALQKLQKQLQDKNERLQDSQALLGSILNNSLDGICVFSAIRNHQEKIVDLQCILINWAAEKFFQEKAINLVGKNLLAEIPKIRDNGLFDLAVAVIETGESIDTEFCWKNLNINKKYNKNNYPFWLQVAAVKLYDGISVTFRDITDRKKSESDLRESEERFRAIFEQAALGIGKVSLSGHFLRVNPGLCKILGYEESELLQMNCYDITYPEDVDLHSEPMQQLLMGKIPNFSLEKRLICKKQLIRWVNATVSLVRDIEGNPDYLIAAIEDISERKLAQEQLQTSLKAQTHYAEELARSNAELEQFAYVASHDLQAPLATIASYAQLLENRYQDNLDAASNKFISKIISGSMRMQTLIDDLLEYSRVGRKNKPFEVIDCNQVFAEACANLQLAIRKNQAVITHNNLPEIMADFSQMVQLFQNLIGNGIKYRRLEDIPVVHISASLSENLWLFSVQDNGIGIAPQHQSRIFQIFQRLHTEKEYPGTGIGLAICQKIVERHGGRIWVESQPEIGTIFYFTLPQK